MVVNIRLNFDDEEYDKMTHKNKDLQNRIIDHWESFGDIDLSRTEKNMCAKLLRGWKHYLPKIMR